MKRALRVDEDVKASKARVKELMESDFSGLEMEMRVDVFPLILTFSPRGEDLEGVQF